MKDFYNKYKQFYPNEYYYYNQSTQRRQENNKEQLSNQEYDEINSIHSFKMIDKEKSDSSNKKENDYDQALSLNDKFRTENIKLETNSKKELFFYVPEENIQSLFTISLENNTKNVKLNYLKHNSFLGNKRNNDNKIDYNLNEPNNNNNENILDIFKNIFRSRKSFYADNEIRKNLNKEYYNKFINDIAYKYSNSLFDVVKLNNYIYSNYKSLDRLTLSTVSSCYLKERNINNANLYFCKLNIIINSLYFLINRKIALIQLCKTNQEEIMFIGESGIGKTYSLYLYTYILRLNPFNLVISIFEINEFMENPVLYLQKEIAYSLYYACVNNSEIDFKDLTDCLKMDISYDDLMENLNSLVSKLFEAYDNELNLYVIIDGLEKAENSEKNKGKELIDKLITSLYNVSISYFGTENKEFLDRFKVIYFCNSDNSNSDSIIKEKMSDFSKKKYFSCTNYSNFFEQGIIFLEADSIYKEEEISYFIEKNEISKEDFSNNREKNQILKNIMEYTDSNFKKILWLIKDNKFISNIKENKCIQKYLNINLEEWLYDTIFQFQKLSFEQQVKIYHFIYSCQNLNEMNENLTQSFFLNGYKAFNYSLIIPKIVKTSDDFFISFKLKNKNLTVFLKNLDMDKLYKKINLSEVTLQCLINEYSATKSAILRGLILEEMLFVIFKSALKEKKILKFNFNVQIYAKKIDFNDDLLVKNNQLGIIISHIEKAMSREDDIFEKDYIFLTNNNSINNNDLSEISEENDGIYFLSHKFPCIDVVVKNGKNLYLIQVKKTLMFDHIFTLNKDMHYFYLMEDENIFKELERQNEFKMRKNKFNTKLNFFLKLFKLHKKHFNFKFIFVYQAKESTLNINKITDENNIKEKYLKENSEISYRLDDKWKGPIDWEENNSKKMFYINNDYFLKIKCKKVYNNILLTTLDNFSNEIQNILKISLNGNFFSTLKE